MLFSIDRFEGDVAVLIDENEGVVHARRDVLPPDVQCGDMLRLVDGNYVSDTDATAIRREAILRLQAKLRK